ncbi:MAG: hypothetical protein Q4C30_09040 [Bacteroidia bacterium]|nr:hypothetical protein [Bacteroidia bacterium]
MKSRIFFLGLLPCLAYMLTSCDGGKSGNNVENSQVVVEGRSEVDSLNASPLLDDADGSIAKSLLDSGISMSSEILLSAQGGDVESIRYVAWMYSYGIGGVNANRKEAYKYYRMLAEKGDAEGETMLGYMTLYGLSGVEDMELGLEMLNRAMRQNYGLAYYIMADFLDNHVEETEDTKGQAQVYYEMAEKLM